MNLLPVSPASPNLAPADGARSAEPSGESGFSDVLTQQKGRIAQRGEPMARDASGPARSSDTDEPQAQAPEETLALLAAGALLPWTAARADERARATDSDRGIHQGSKGRQAISAANMPGLDDADLRPDGKAATAALPDRPDIRQSGTPRVPVADSFAHTPAARDADGTAPAVARDTAPGIRASAAIGARNMAETRQTAAQGLAEIAIPRAAAVSIAQAPEGPSITELSSAAPGASLLQGTGLPQAAAPIAAAMTTPLSSPDWAADFGRQFLTIAQGRDASHIHTAELRLDPPGLGPVRITLHVGDSITNVSFVSPHAVVRQAIENALPQLQQQLDQAGLSLGQANVSDQSPGGQGFDQPTGNGSNGGPAFALEGAGAIAAHDSLAPGSMPRTAGRQPDTLVDTFV